MSKFISEKIKKKSAARLASVQANYMIALSGLPVEEVIRDFVQGKVGGVAIEEEKGGEEENFVKLEPIDAEYFTSLVKGVQSHKEELENSLNSYLRGDRPYDKLNTMMQSLLLSAVYEISSTSDVDVKVLIQEYVDLAYAFFDKNEPKMVNALLDQIAHAVRG